MCQIRGVSLFSGSTHRSVDQSGPHARHFLFLSVAFILHDELRLLLRKWLPHSLHQVGSANSHEATSSLAARGAKSSMPSSSAVGLDGWVVCLCPLHRQPQSLLMVLLLLKVLLRDYQGCRHDTLVIFTHEPHTAARLRKLAGIAPRAHVDGPGFPPTDTMSPHQCAVRALTPNLAVCHRQRAGLSPWASACSTNYQASPRPSVAFFHLE